MKGFDIEIPFTPEIFKQMTWKLIQKTMFGTESTTKLTTAEIDQILDVLINFFAERGIEVSFPNRFNDYLKIYE